MRILFAGATGAIGRPLLPMLVAAGHEVHAVTRSPEKAATLQAAGAIVELADLLEPGAANALIASVAPEVVIDQLTSLPQDFDPRKANAAYAANDRVREVGSGALIAAAENGGVRRYVAQSVAFLYRPGGSQLRGEGDPVWSDAPAPFDHSVAVLVANEKKLLQSTALEGVVLRYGFLYGPGTWYETGGSTFAAVSKRQYPLIGDGAGIPSLVHVHDAATATLAAIGAAPGIYNVVDDDPAAFAELIPEFARIIGAKPPRRLPAWLARLVVGKYLVAAATALAGASNELAKSELDWQPAIASWRTGLRDYRDGFPAA